MCRDGELHYLLSIVSIERFRSCSHQLVLLLVHTQGDNGPFLSAFIHAIDDGDLFLYNEGPFNVNRHIVTWISSRYY